MKDTEKRFEFIPFLINLIIPLLFGAFASLFRSQVASTWYISLNKPTYYPTFTGSGVLRSLMTFTIGVSAFLIWRERQSIKHYTRVIIFYFLQLSLNFLWAIIFFDRHWINLSIAISVILVLVALFNNIVFFRVNKFAGILFIFYLLWVSLIAYLTIGIYLLN